VILPPEDSLREGFAQVADAGKAGFSSFFSAFSRGKGAGLDGPLKT
jgi:hypothetical protein